MTNYTRSAAVALVFILHAPLVSAQTTPGPAGDWLVKNKTAHIHIADCGGALWGVIDWVDKPGTDSENPDPAKRTRSVLGLPILLGMRPGEGGQWDGDIYNADNGKTYHSHIKLVSADSLHVQGCVFMGLLCGGEDWTRLKPAAPADANPTCPH